MFECDFTNRGGSGVKIYRPPLHRPAGVLGKIIGTVSGIPADQLANIHIVQTATDKNGAGFFASVRPAAIGTFSFKKMPAGAKYTLELRGFNLFALKSDPVTIQGTAAKANTDKDFNLAGK